jgi:hypothetical protein
MKRTVLQKAFADGLIERAGRLEAGLIPRWGTLTPAEMLRHCTVTNEQILTWEGTLRPATLWQRVVKWYSLYLLSRFPRHVKGPKRYDMRGQVADGQFETEKSRLISQLRKFPHLRKPLYSPHPFFGPLTTREWGWVVYRHLDHHFRQFGV